MSNVRAVLTGVLSLFVFTAAAEQVLDRIAVVVNEGVVMESELEYAISNTKRQLSQRDIAIPPDAELRNQVLERLILIELQTQRARDAGMRIDDQELNQVLSNIASQNGLSLGQFARQLRRDGIDYLGLREQVRDEMLINRLRQREVEARVNVTDREIDLFLSNQAPDDDSEYRLSHILITAGEGSRADAREQINALRERIAGGEAFAEVAVAHSDGQQALDGGDLGWRSADELPKLFADTVQTLGVGQVSPVLEAASGFHLVKLEDARGGTPREMVTETKARHILIQPDAIVSEDEARDEAQRIYEKLQDGADFAELAREHSDDPGSKNSAGDLGWQSPGTFAPEFQIKLDQLDPGEISKPFRTQFGWHIAQLLDRRTVDRTAAARRAQARDAIRQRKVEEEYDVWLRRLRDEAYVEYRLGDDAENATG